MEDELENLKENSNWGGVREGAGRKEGSENEDTKERRIAEKEMKDRIIRSKDALLNAQMSIAQGTQMLFKIEKEIDEKGNEKKSKPILITSQSEIEAYLAGEFNDGDDYYFITTERPENKAIDSLFNRVLGTPRATVDMNLSSDDDLRKEYFEKLNELDKRYSKDNIQK